MNTTIYEVYSRESVDGKKWTSNKAVYYKTKAQAVKEFKALAKVYEKLIKENKIMLFKADIHQVVFKRKKLETRRNTQKILKRNA